MKWRLAVVGVLSVIGAAHAQINFATFTSKECGFSILMPGMPKEQTTKIKSALGELENKQFVLATPNKVLWMVSVVDYPAGTANDRQDALLDGAVKAALTNLNGKTLSEGKIALDDKYPGRQLQVEVEKVGIYRAHIFLVGDRIYQIVVRGTKEGATSAEATKYVESFKLVK